MPTCANLEGRMGGVCRKGLARSMDGGGIVGGFYLSSQMHEE